MLLACSAAYPAFAQNVLPQCENTNYDSKRGLFTVINPAPNTVNQQCLLTVHPAQASASGAQYPAPYMVEGRYVILMSGGGGGGAGGEYWNRGGGSGGAGAAPIRTVQYLSPGVHKLTIGTGGEGGMPGGSTYNGNLTSLTNADTGAFIAGHPGADVSKQIVLAPEAVGHGGKAQPGGSRGGDGGASGSPSSESAAQAGGASQTAGYAGTGGQAGVERNARPDDVRVPPANAGGGGGAGVGSGGAGEPRDGNRAGGVGDLGGGGAGGRGGFFTAHPGGQGGHGFIRLTRTN